MRQFSKDKMMDPLKKVAVEGVAEGITIGMKVQKDRVLDIIDDWKRPSELRLRAGEMTAQEMRTVLAVLGVIEAQIKRIGE